jgi:hypothetical protein
MKRIRKNGTFRTGGARNVKDICQLLYLKKMKAKLEAKMTQLAEEFLSDNF